MKFSLSNCRIHVTKFSFFTIPFLLISLIVINAEAQEIKRCYNPQLLNAFEQEFPGTKQKVLAANLQAEEWLKNYSGTRSVITVPVVVHVIWNTPAQNVPDKIIQSQMEVLNEDFRRENADTFYTPDPFKSVAGDCMIQFCLAVQDPDGNPTSGITRTFTNKSSFSLDNASIYHTNLGGEDAWPSTDYLNIWVLNIDGGYLGLGSPPGSSMEQDGILVHYLAFGRYFSPSYQYNSGRSCTHEVGHWLSLSHVWSEGGHCINSDQINDTPLQDDHTFGCPTFPVLDSCSSVYPGIAFNDYMDYTDDACMNMFTKEQAAKMYAVLETSRSSILQSNGSCVPVSFGDDASAVKIVIPFDTLESESFVPRIQIANRGINNLTSATIYFKVDDQKESKYYHSGNLSTNQSEVVNLETYYTNGGGHVATARSSQPNGHNDENINNDTTAQVFTILNKIEENTINVFPIPSSGIFNVSILNPEAAEIDIRVVNILGQIVQHHFINNPSSNSFIVDISGEPNGIYILYAKIGYSYKAARIMIAR